MDDVHQTLHKVVDVGALAALFGILVGWLPAATTVLVFIVAVIRFFETATVRLALKRLKTWLSG